MIDVTNADGESLLKVEGLTKDQATVTELIAAIALIQSAIKRVDGSIQEKEKQEDEKAENTDK